MKTKTDNVAERIQRLLDGVDRLKRASQIDRPVRFNAAGERRANAVALAYEIKKPHFSWTVKARVPRFNGDKIDMQEKELSGIVAQNETDAWAKFCDQIGTWPSRTTARPTFAQDKQVDESAAAAVLMKQPHYNAGFGS